MSDSMWWHIWFTGVGHSVETLAAFVIPVVVMVSAVRVLHRRASRYRGRHRGPVDVGVDIFEPHSNCRCVVTPELEPLRWNDLMGFTAAGQPVYYEDIGPGPGKVEPKDIITRGVVSPGVVAVEQDFADSLTWERVEPPDAFQVVRTGKRRHLRGWRMFKS